MKFVSAFFPFLVLPAPLWLSVCVCLSRGMELLSLYWHLDCWSVYTLVIVLLRLRSKMYQTLFFYVSTPNCCSSPSRGLRFIFVSGLFKLSLVRLFATGLLPTCLPVILTPRQSTSAAVPVPSAVPSREPHFHVPEHYAGTWVWAELSLSGL